MMFCRADGHGAEFLSFCLSGQVDGIVSYGTNFLSFCLSGQVDGIVSLGTSFLSFCLNEQVDKYYFWQTEKAKSNNTWQFYMAITKLITSYNYSYFSSHVYFVCFTGGG